MLHFPTILIVGIRDDTVKVTKTITEMPFSVLCQLQLLRVYKTWGCGKRDDRWLEGESKGNRKEENGGNLADIPHHCVCRDIPQPSMSMSALLSSTSAILPWNTDQVTWPTCLFSVKYFTDSELCGQFKAVLCQS